MRIKTLQLSKSFLKIVMWRVALAAALLLVLVGPAAAPLRSGLIKAQPELLQLITTHPEATFSVIVQKTDQSNYAESQTIKLGGHITKDLHIINAFAAEMPAATVIELSKLASVRWVSLDAPVAKSGGPDGTISTTALLNVYNKAIGADRLWAQGYQGSSVTVAVVDSGWNNNDDFRATSSGGDMRLRVRVGFNGNETNLDDHYAHGIHVAGLIGGNGRISKGKYIGVAPMVNFVSVKVSDGTGQGTTSGIVQGLQWIYDNRLTYNIRIVNLSINSTVAESYHTSPLSAALEILWFNNIVVVVSAGNNGSGSSNGILYPPANDPFVITVGAVNDRGTALVTDDVLAPYSAYGITSDGFAKPDLVAPGHNLIAPLSSGGAELAQLYPTNKVNGKTDYFRMSGTSMAAAVTSGAVALLLQDESNLTPDQVKYRLMNTPSRLVAAGNRNLPYLNIYNAVIGTSTASANTGLQASQLLWTGSQPVTWSSVSWNSVSWNSVSWNSVSWNSVSWNSVSWNSTYWGP